MENDTDRRNGGSSSIPIPSFTTTPFQSNTNKRSTKIANGTTESTTTTTTASPPLFDYKKKVAFIESNTTNRKRKSSESSIDQRNDSSIHARRKLSLPQQPPPSSSLLLPQHHHHHKHDTHRKKNTTPLSTLLRAEAALDLSLRSNRYNRRKKGERLLVTLPQFYRIVSNLSLSSSSSSAAAAAATTTSQSEKKVEEKKRSTLNETQPSAPSSDKKNNPIMELTTPEKILFDLIRIASPELYRLVTIDNDNNTHQKSTVQLEMVMHTSLTTTTTSSSSTMNKLAATISRMDQLKQLYKIRCGAVRHFVEARILSSILQEKKKVSTPCTTKTPAKTNNPANNTANNIAKTPDSPSFLFNKEKSFKTPVSSHPPPLQQEEEEEGDNTEDVGGVTPLHTNIKSTSLLLEPYILPGMTLQQRVEARAKFKREREERFSKRKLLQMKQQSSNGEDDLVKTKTDRVVLLQFADALRSMIRLVRSRGLVWKNVSSVGRRVGQTSQSLRSSKEPTTIVRSAKTTSLSLKDVCVHFNKTGMGFSANQGGGMGGAGIPSMSVRTDKKRATSKEVMAMLNDLVLVVPEWIRVETTRGSGIISTSQKEKKQKKKESFVFVRNDVDYQAVRVKLGGRSWGSFPKKSKNNIAIEEGNEKSLGKEVARQESKGTTTDAKVLTSSNRINSKVVNDGSSSPSSTSTPTKKNTLRTSSAMLDVTKASKSSSSFSSAKESQQQAESDAAKISLDADDVIRKRRRHPTKSTVSSSSSRPVSGRNVSSGGRSTSKRAEMMLLAGRSSAQTSRLDQKANGSGSLLVPPQTAKRKLLVGTSDNEDSKKKRKADDEDRASNAKR